MSEMISFEPFRFIATLNTISIYFKQRKDLLALASRDIGAEAREAWKSEINIRLAELNSNLESQMSQSKAEVENAFKNKVLFYNFNEHCWFS